MYIVTLVVTLQVYVDTGGDILQVCVDTSAKLP